jgi:glyoxylase-like metal-dependent hydrolase (beta-lactamase superfamily II)
MFLLKAFTFNPLQENTYVLYNEQKEALIIDPGCYFDEEKEALASFINSNQLQVKYLLNTHCHLDHVFGNKWIFEQFHTKLHLHPLEVEVLKMAPASGLMWGIPFDNYADAYIYLNPGNQIILGNDCLDILWLPGHSPGHLGFYCKKQDFIISGDVLFRESIGRTDLPGGNMPTLIESIKTQLWALPDETKVYSGHGPETNIRHEKLHNPFLT